MKPLFHEVGRSTRSNLAKLPWFARFYYAPLWAYLGVCAVFIFGVETPLDENHVFLFWELRFIAMPLAVLVFGTAYRHRVYLRLVAQKRKRSPLLITVLLYVLTLVFGVAIPIAFNASDGSAPPVYLHGPVVRKYISTGRYNSYVLVIDEQTTNRQLSFDVSEEAYDQTPIGSEFSRAMRKGRLGVPYRWRFGN